MATKKARVYFGNEENAFECEFDEYKSLEEAKAALRRDVQAVIDDEGASKEFTPDDFISKDGLSADTRDEFEYRSIWGVGEQGDYRRARKEIDDERSMMRMMF